MAEAFLAGLIGFLIGRGVEPQDATAIVETLRDYLGYEPPLGLTGYALNDIQAGKEANSAIVVRGKAYDVVALADITKHSPVSVLGRKGDRLEVAPTIEALKVVDTVELIKLIQTIDMIENIATIHQINPSGIYDTVIDKVGKIDDIGYITWLNTLNKVNTINNISTITYLGTLNTLNTIQQINNIKTIEEIKRVYIATTIPNNVCNGDFEAGDFYPWIPVETPQIVTTPVYQGKYAARIEVPEIGYGSGIMQNLPPVSTDGIHFCLWHNTTINKHLAIKIRYADDTESDHQDTGTGAWKFQFITPTAAKYLKDIYIRDIDSGTVSYLDDVRCA